MTISGRVTAPHARSITREGVERCASCGLAWPCPESGRAVSVVSQRIDVVTEHLCGHRACDQEDHRRRAADLLTALVLSPADGGPRVCARCGQGEAHDCSAPEVRP